MSSSSSGLVTVADWPFMRPFSARSLSRSSFICCRCSRLDVRPYSRLSMPLPSTSFSFCTNCSFSLRCVRTCTVVVVFLRSLSSSSLRSSIFSFRLWFSILSCSKSMRCSPSLSSSFCFRVCSRRRSWYRRWMFFSRARSISDSFLSSCSIFSAMTRSGMAFPVRLFSALRATSYLKLLNALRMSLARFTRSPRWLCTSVVVVS
mmetsp:Transcript_18327/g.45591  ORF Transcript_18327/g.45591 Transcript_18327/m.45591 type:complete len:204 (+) Transcript_18327:1077-1688(+)